MNTYTELQRLVDLLTKQVDELMEENRKLSEQTTNISKALSNANAQNVELCNSYNDAVEALNVLGVNDNVEN